MPLKSCSGLYIWLQSDLLTEVPGQTVQLNSCLQTHCIFHIPSSSPLSLCKYTHWMYVCVHVWNTVFSLHHVRMMYEIQCSVCTIQIMYEIPSYNVQCIHHTDNDKIPTMFSLHHTDNVWNIYSVHAVCTIRIM